MSGRRLKISMFLKLTGREKRLFLEAFLLHLWIGLVLKFVPFRLIPRMFGSPQPSVGSLRLLRRRRLNPAHEVSGHQSSVGSLRLLRRRRLNPAHEVSGQQSSVGSQNPEIMMVKRAVERANVVSPWRNRCLVSSLVARSMLNRRNIPSQLSLGVSKDAGGRTVAHAWLISGTVDVTGKQGDFQELFVF